MQVMSKKHSSLDLTDPNLSFWEKSKSFEKNLLESLKFIHFGTKSIDLG